MLRATGQWVAWNVFLDLHIAFSVGAKLPLAGVDPTRLQRATEGPD